MRALLFFFAVLVAAAFGLVIVGLNVDVVTVRLPLFAPLELELWKVLFGGVGIGAAVALAFDGAGRIRRFVRERRRRRGRRDLEEGERLFREGLGEMASGRFDAALLSLEAAAEYAGGDPETLRRKAECLMRLGRPGEAVTVLEEAAADDRRNLEVAYALAAARIANGEPGRARTQLEKTITEDPSPPATALGELRDLLAGAGELREALSVQQRLLSTTPRPGRPAEEARALALRHALGVQLLGHGEAVEAARVFRTVLEEDPRAVAAWVQLGRAYLKAGNDRAATDAWQRGFRETGATPPLVALQDYYLDRTCPEEAISVWKRAVAETRTQGGKASVETRYLLGKLYDRLFMLDEAVGTLAGLSDLESPVLAARLTRILESRGDLSGAVARARAVLARNPSVTAEYACSRCGARCPDWTDACEACGGFGTVVLDLGEGSAAAGAPALASQPVV